MSPRWHRAAVACAGVALLFLTGCGQQEKQDNEERSAGYGRQIEDVLPGIVRSAGWDSVGSLREVSCVGVKADPDSLAQETAWRSGSGMVNATPAQAKKVADGVRSHAEQTDWDSAPGPGEYNQDMLYRATKGDLYLMVRYRTGVGRPHLEVSIGSPCLEMPEDHTMTRSELDPGYGSSDRWYPGEDSSRFVDRDGEAKPLPE